MNDYVVSSLELHLFYTRIMKEHAFFLEIGFTKAAPKCVLEANRFKEAFEELLCQVTECSEGIVRSKILNSGEIVTQYTCCSEKKTELLTDASIDQDITKKQNELVKGQAQETSMIDQSLINEVKAINQWTIKLLERFIEFKKWTVHQMVTCKLYTSNYPLLIEHMIREAELYESYIKELECKGAKKNESLQKVELFWNQIMMEHAQFIRGLLDPSETELIHKADSFAKEYRQLLKEACNRNKRTMRAVTKETMNQTIRYREFKAAGAKGMNECQICSLILPLLADHVLREANHYLRILSEYLFD